ncbi:hypothetical protein A2W32_04165 [candidate division WWE3 bacterium RBG_16_37_10]|uniref:Bacterial Ig domain-containing protein n=1 Tax=candidate division WWE3 bacterium RBG_16_37_10 TaxID=1802610 RepID=A0A1F4UV28_UNCKA|nr:MAG: hypothetical protein A2W32_04165 [candidate division WWE3 bacterium RBG_16_37_10]
MINKDYLLNLDYRKLSNQELKQRLVTLLLINVLTIGSMVAAITLFGPQIGGMLAFISIHRNEKDKDNITTTTTPIFSNVPKATNKESFTLNGIAKPGSEIKLFVNGPETTSTTADSNGLFTFVDVGLVEGANIIFAKAIDSDNNESPPSQVITIELDNKAPDIQMESPKDGDIIKNLDKRIIVKGKVNEKAVIKVNEKLAILKNDLSFEAILGVEEGDLEIKIMATDEAGNKKEESLKIKYEKKS